MTLSNTLQRVIKLISKPPVNRCNAEIDLLLPWLRKRSDVLRNLEKDILIELMRNCSYRRVSRDDVIIRQGETGDCFYIMLTGKASVYIDTVKSGEDQTSYSLSKYAVSSGSAASGDAGGGSPTAEDGAEYLDEFWRSRRGESSQAKWAVDRSQFGKFIIYFDAGTSFGEIALISDDAVRNASILADEMTDLMVINRGLFNGTLKAKQEAEYQERKNFIKKCALFRNWSSKFRRLCEMSLRKVSLPFDTVLIKQGDPVVGLHFIFSGQGKVTVDPQLHRSQYPKLFEVSEEDNAKEPWQRQKKDETKPKETSLREQIRVRRREGYAAAERRLAKRTVTMCYVDESEIIGDTELMLGLETYTHSVICTANTKVFILDNKNIERLIQKKNPHTLDKLRQIVEAKLQSRTRMRVGSQIPLYRHLLEKIQGAQSRRLATGKQRDDEEKPKTISETAADRDLMVAQLSKLFIQNKTPFIEPSVPGSLFYLTKSADRARRKSAVQRMQAGQELTGGGLREARLYRARRALKRQPRSRRELERLTLGPSAAADNKHDDHHKRYNFYASQVGGRRPVSAIVLAAKPPKPSSLNDSLKERTKTCGDQVQLGYNDIINGEMKEVVKELNQRQQTTNATRSKVICSMMDKQNAKSEASAIVRRPKSAPTPASDDDVDDDADADDDEDFESFDWETSNHALKELEDKLRSFYVKHGSGQGFKRTHANVIELKRFNIQSPEDVPIPGGTVYVRQRLCQFAGGAVSNTAHHQHIRRYIIPKDAYRVAVMSLNEVDSKPESRTPSPANPAPARTPSTRPFSSAPRARGAVNQSATTRSRIQSAPMKRNGLWS